MNFIHTGNVTSCNHESLMSHVWHESFIRHFTWIIHGMTHSYDSCHMNDSCHVRMSHVTHTNGSCHTYEWVMSHMSYEWFIHLRHFTWIIHAMTHSPMANFHIRQMNKTHPHRVAKMHRMPCLYRLFPAKEPCNSWLVCGKRSET